jgi:hypothetical protein
MLKSIFAKYVSAFTAIVLCSFIMIILIISAIVGNYSEKAKAELMDKAAHTSAEYIEKSLDGRSLSEIIDERGEDVSAILSMVCANSDDVTLLVSDSEGRILIAVGEDKDDIDMSETIPSELMDEVNSDKEISNDSQIYDVFSSPRYIYAVPIHEDGQVCGTVFVCASSVMLSDLLEYIIISNNAVCTVI